MPTLYDYHTHEPIRPATTEEERDSAASPDGLIVVDWRQTGGWNGEDARQCYVSGDGD